MITRRNFIIGTLATAGVGVATAVEARPIRARSIAWHNGQKAYRAGVKLSDNPEVGYREAWAEGWEYAKWYDGLTPEKRAAYDAEQAQYMIDSANNFNRGIQTIFTIGAVAIAGMIGFTVWLVRNT